jgi:pentatricopeptide repeat protein
MSDQERLEDLLGEAYHLDNGDAKVQLLEEAVKLADALQDVDMSFYSRMQFTEAATFAGRSERLMTSFSWCLAKYKEDPEQFEEYGYDLLWQFKWVIGGVSTFPHITYSTLLRSLAQLNRYDEADEFHAKNYRLIRRNPEFIRQVAEHISYLTHRGNLKKAVSLLEKHVGWITGTYELMPRYYFLTAAAHLLDRLGEGKKKLKLPKEFEKHDPSGKYDLSQLAGWFKGERDELGAAFDKRNGNDYYSRRVPELLHYDGINA